jgi:hypothetical protein
LPRFWYTRHSPGRQKERSLRNGNWITIPRSTQLLAKRNVTVHTPGSNEGAGWWAR